MGAGSLLCGQPVLVTGAGGFVGARLIERLHVVEGAKVRALLRSARGAARIATWPVDIRYGDVRDTEYLRTVARGCTAVFHGASAIDGAGPLKTTTYLGAIAAAEACGDVGARLIHISSCSVYGTPTSSVSVDETAPYRPRFRNDTYAQAKIAAERELQRMSRFRSLRVAVLQPTMIFGPHSSEWTLAPLAMLDQADIAMPARDNSVCNAVHVDDVVRAAVLALGCCNERCESYLINGKGLPTWTEYLSHYADMGTAGKIVPASQPQLKRLQSEAARSTSLLRTLARAVSQKPDLRAELLSTRTLGRAFNLLQRHGPRSLTDALRRSLTGKELTADVPRGSGTGHRSLPLRVAPEPFLGLTSQRHTYSSDKARKAFGYNPEHSVASAMPELQRWAEWSRLVPARSKVS